MRPRPILLVACLLILSTATAQEVQQHGLVFERWVRDVFFDGYTPARYTQDWDIPASANKNHGAIPANPKLCKYGTAVDLGDALRQYRINEPFLLIIGFWRQEAGNKRIVGLIAPKITPALWRKLWGPVTLEDLQRLDALIKDRTTSVREIRKLARQMKNAPPFTGAIIQVNPKIGTDGQRRLQCSIRFADVYKHLAPGADSAPQDKPVLWGVEFPGPIVSPARRIN